MTREVVFEKKKPMSQWHDVVWAGLRGVDFLPAEKLQRSFTAQHSASLSIHDEAKSAREYSWQNRSNGK
jgi:hypothetical protein